jgi:hypothetical protein
VPGVVQSGPADLGLGEDVLPLAVVGAGVDRLAVGLGEDEAGADPLGASREALGGLGDPVGLEGVVEGLG